MKEKGCLCSYLAGFLDGVRVHCLCSSEAVGCSNCEVGIRSEKRSVKRLIEKGNSEEYDRELNQLQYEDMMNERSEVLRDI
jgi:hypothetical protein